MLETVGVMYLNMKQGLRNMELVEAVGGSAALQKSNRVTILAVI